MAVRDKWVWATGAGAAIVVAGLAVWATLPDPRDRVDTHRNIILVVVDTLRADHLGLYGYETDGVTPNIDRIGRKGRWFESAWATAPWTTPSVMSLMTSTNPIVHGFNIEADRFGVSIPNLSSSIQTLAQVLNSQGYRTLAVSGGGGVRGAYGFDRGFDTYFEPEEIDGEDIEDGVDHALELISSTNDERYFLFLHTYEVHLPNTHALLTGNDLTAGQAIEAYDGDLSFTDHHLGRLFNELERLNQLEDTLLIITSDHGENLHDRPPTDHPVGHGHHLHDELLRVPLVLVAPGLIPATGLIPETAILTDVMPTILSLAGIPSDGLRMQGDDLRGTLQNWTQGGEDRPVISGAPFQGPTWHSIRTDDAKLMITPYVEGRNWWNRIKKPPKSLFLLEADALERNNVYSSQPDLVAELEDLLREQLAADNTFRRDLGPLTFETIDDDVRENLSVLGYIEP